ncbi:hypothetical protein PFTANZ_03093 [Plasmodium falciparum Tanzania (2000708)]|uniref:Leucine-rich repeat protein n=1 Tax=Plasmodium falciparum Tanzania (2000708) TaxID=1036725 RepID=A0A024W6M4_PLAFA|nr:hypothetical protein PFTANZ_03093 [Plasmodium falciparum Tanzania (2000708)]
MIENIEHLTNLEELWLGKNKIEQINLPYLPKLKKLSVQHNRLTDICEKSIKNILCVEELYISYNKINHIIDTFKDLKHLKVFDLSYNEINNISICSYLKSLEELCRNNIHHHKKKNEVNNTLEEYKDIIPDIEIQIENLLKKFHITKYDYKITHFLIDIIQNESLKILKNAKHIKKNIYYNNYNDKDDNINYYNINDEHINNNENNDNIYNVKENAHINHDTLYEEKYIQKEEGTINHINNNTDMENINENNSPNKCSSHMLNDLLNNFNEDSAIEKNSHIDVVNNMEDEKQENKDELINKDIPSNNKTDNKENNHIPKNNPLNCNDNNQKNLQNIGNNKNKIRDEVLIIDEESVNLAIKEYVLKTIYRKKNVDFLYEKLEFQQKDNLMVNRNIKYPSGLPPYLPDDCSVNTILPSWDIKYNFNSSKRKIKK